jgi:hypothetical protein
VSAERPQLPELSDLPGALPERPELPEARGLGGRILSALGRLSTPDAAEYADELSDEFDGDPHASQHERPESALSVTRVRDALRAKPEEPSEPPLSERPRANPVADRILGALRNPPSLAADSSKPVSGSAGPNPATRILEALEVAVPDALEGPAAEELTAAPAHRGELEEYDYTAPPPPLPSFEAAASTRRADTFSLRESDYETSVLVPSRIAAAGAPTRSEPAHTIGEDSVLIANPPPPRSPHSVTPSSAGMFPARGAAENASSRPLPQIASGSRPLRSLGVFGGSTGPSGTSYPTGITRPEPIGELASELAREASEKRGLRTEVVALAAGIFLLAAGALVYWASTPPTIVRPPTIRAVEPSTAAPGSTLPAFGAETAPTTPTAEASARLDAAIATFEPVSETKAPTVEPREAAAPAVARSEATPAAEAEPTGSNGLRFWPPVEQSAASAPAPDRETASRTQRTPAAESAPTPTPVATVQPTRAAEPEPVEQPAELPEPVVEAVTSTPVAAEPPPLPLASAGSRVPGAIASPALAARLLPVTVRAGAGASIEIDGIDRGKAPLFGILLSAGTHRAVALAPDGTRTEQLFEVNEQNLEIVFDGRTRR